MAVVVGLVFGSLACTVAMASSAGIAERSVVGAHLEHADAGHHGPGHHGDVTVPGAPSGALQADGHGGHPGMACVVAIDLRVPGAAPITSTGSIDVRPDGACVDRLVDVEPPVPRFS